MFPNIPDIGGRGAGRRLAQALLSGGADQSVVAADLANGSASRKFDERLRRLASELNVSVRTTASESDSYGRYEAEADSDLFSREEVVAESQSKSLRKYILAHELGHAALHRALSNRHVSDQERLAFVDEASRERFCREFASEVALPTGALRDLSYDIVKQATDSSYAQRVDELAGDGFPRLTFYHLASLAKTSGAPILVLLRGLNHHRLLSEAEVGLSVFRMAHNAFTGAEWGLRAWINACPPWGYLPTNRRAARLGFVAAEDVLVHGANGSSALRKQTIDVKVRSEVSTPRERQWVSQSLQTHCCYTPIRTRNQGGFLFASWHWERK